MCLHLASFSMGMWQGHHVSDKPRGGSRWLFWNWPEGCVWRSGNPGEIYRAFLIPIP